MKLATSRRSHAEGGTATANAGPMLARVMQPAPPPHAPFFHRLGTKGPLAWRLESKGGADSGKGTMDP